MNDKIYDWRKLNLQGLDILLCAGKMKLSGRIQTFQRFAGAPKIAAKISHAAGLVDFSSVTGSNMIENIFSMDGLFVEESTTLNKWSGRKGVQVNPFKPWLANYNGKVYVRKLNFVRNAHFVRRDMLFWEKHKNDDYENGIPGAMELFLCGLRLHRFVRALPFMGEWTPAFTDDPHCTELKALRLRFHQLWNRWVITNRMPPWLWWKEIDKWLMVPISEPIRIK